MSAHSPSNKMLAATCLTAPLFGLVAAAANPALGGSNSSKLLAISRHSGAFYLYAICILISSYLLVPAVLGVIAVIRESQPRWVALFGGCLAVVGTLVAVGDAATELVYWQMAKPAADHQQMVALADRYDSTAGASLVYTVGGLGTIVGVALLGVGLWRSGAAPRWAGVAMPVAVIANIAGFSMGSTAVLVASYLILLVAFVPIARALGQNRQSPGIVDGATALVAQPAGH